LADDLANCRTYQRANVCAKQLPDGNTNVQSNGAAHSAPDCCSNDASHPNAR
jgi:hypothetical protein